MADPYPDDESKTILNNADLSPADKLPEVPGDMVYGPTRYIENFSPYCVYIPKQEMMFKIMRACVNVKDPMDLWFNRLEGD